MRISPQTLAGDAFAPVLHYLQHLFIYSKGVKPAQAGGAAGP